MPENLSPFSETTTFIHEEQPEDLEGLDDDGNHEGPNGAPNVGACSEYLRRQEGNDYKVEEVADLPERRLQRPARGEAVDEHADQRREIEAREHSVAWLDEAVPLADDAEGHADHQGDQEDLNGVVDEDPEPAGAFG